MQHQHVYTDLESNLHECFSPSNRVWQFATDLGVSLNLVGAGPELRILHAELGRLVEQYQYQRERIFMYRESMRRDIADSCNNVADRNVMNSATVATGVTKLHQSLDEMYERLHVALVQHVYDRVRRLVDASGVKRTPRTRLRKPSLTAINRWLEIDASVIGVPPLYPSREHKARIGYSAGMTVQQVGIWFGNCRARQACTTASTSKRRALV